MALEAHPPDRDDAALVDQLQRCQMLAARIGVHPTAGFSRPERWTTLCRWAAAARDGRLWRCVVGDASWTLRQCAGRAARNVATFADPSLEPAARAFAGAMHAR